MTDINPSAVSEDLDLFSADFFGQNQPAPESTPEPSQVQEGETTPVEDDITEDDAPVPDIDNDTIEDEPEVKPKKNRFQERIDELTGKQREAERRAQEVEAKLNEALQKLEASQPKPTVSPDGPSPDDLNEDGSDKYPLGEFDKNYIRDLTKHTLEQEREALKAKDAQERQTRESQQKAVELQNQWNEKLTPAQERYPDYAEKGQELIASTEGLYDGQLLQQFTDTIMSMEHGPDVFYFLANNPEEAHNILKSGPVKGAIALGRIEARFDKAAEEKKVRVSKAPPPPPTNKGSSAVKTVTPDTDDLDQFASLFFKKR